MSGQLTLFNGHSVNVFPRLKETMRAAVKQSGLSRDQVVDALNDLIRIDGIAHTGRAAAVKIDTLEKWLAPEADHLIPLKFLAAFCRATNSILPIQALLAPLGAWAVADEDNDLLTWARIERDRRKIRKRQKILEGKIGL